MAVRPGRHRPVRGDLPLVGDDQHRHPGFLQHRSDALRPLLRRAHFCRFLPPDARPEVLDGRLSRLVYCTHLAVHGGQCGGPLGGRHFGPSPRQRHGFARLHDHLGALPGQAARVRHLPARLLTADFWRKDLQRARADDGLQTRGRAGISRLRHGLPHFAAKRLGGVLRILPFRRSGPAGRHGDCRPLFRRATPRRLDALRHQGDL